MTDPAPVPPVRRTTGSVAGVGVLIAALFAVRVWPPGSGLLPVCPIKALTGLDCPGCGVTRALAAVSRGDVWAAADHNAAVVAMIVIATVWWALYAVSREPHRPPRRLSLPALPVAAAVATWTVVRNLPIPVLSWFGSGIS